MAETYGNVDYLLTTCLKNMNMFKMTLWIWVGRKPAIQNDDSTDDLILPVLILDTSMTTNN